MTDALQAEREELLARLRALDEEYAAGDLDETDYRNLRDDYTARAAAVLRRLRGEPDELDEGDVAPHDDDLSGMKVPMAVRRRRDAPEATVGGRRQGRVRVVAGLLVLALVAGGAGYALAGSAKERTATDEATGSLPEGSVDRITRAQMLVSDGKVLEAVRVYDDLLKDDPENPVALAQKGWLLSNVDPSLVDSGLASIDRAIAIEPDYPEAHFFRGMILWRGKGEPAMAAESFQRAIDARPPPEVLATIEQVKAQALADAAATAPEGGTATP